MKIVCLANSFRVGGRCLGGVLLDQNNNPVFQNGRPKWIRPVCLTDHEEVPTHLVSHISILDIIEFQNIRAIIHGHQTENVIFETNSLRVVGRFPYNGLEALTENGRFSLVFGNRGAAVPADKAGDFNYSLILLSLTQFETNERVFEEREYSQKKLSFNFNNHTYNLPITDPEFLHQYGLNPAILEGYTNIYVTLSLAEAHEGWLYKLVAGIIYQAAQAPRVVRPAFDEDDIDLPF